MTSSHAGAAKLIRQELKALGIPARVTSKTYAGGNSIRIELVDQPVAIREQVRKLCDKYEYGTFDGMTDCYNVDNRRDDIPQVKYLFVDNVMSDAKRQEVWDNLRSRWGLGTFPASYEKAANERLESEYVSQLVWQEFNRDAA